METSRHPPYISPAEHCASALIKTVPLIMQLIRAEIRQAPYSNLSVPQFRLLAYLEQQPGSSLSKVAEYLDVTKATASTTIERLVQSGHVDRSVDPQERRYVRLQLTDHGLQELEAMRQMIRNQLAALLASLPPEQLASIGTSLQILYQIFQPIA